MPKDSQEEIESELSSSTKLRRTILFIAFFCLVILVIIISFMIKQPGYAPASGCESDAYLEKKVIRVVDSRIDVEIASSDDDKIKGLSGRNCLDEDSGMLFTYNNSSDERCFWMKDMKFSIDIIWLDEQGKITTIHDNVSPDTYPKSFCPNALSKDVLEVRAGKAKKSGWRVGSSVAL